MADSASLITKRATLKGQMTRFQNLVEDICNKVDGYEKKSVQLNKRVDAIKPLLNQFDEIQAKIESLQTSDESDANEIERDQFENNYYTYLQMAENVLIQNGTAGTSSSSSVSGAQPQPALPSQVSNVVALPKIELPTFTGDYHNWLEFRDTFKSLIHNNITISNIQKFHYLKACLKEQAKNIIQSVEFSEANYEVAWSTLLDRYDDKWLIIYNHLHAIFTLPTLLKENLIQLRQLQEHLAKHLHSLKILGQPVEYWDTPIVYVISKKLDPTSKREWESFKYDDELPKIKDMQAFLKQKCMVLEKIQDSLPARSTNNYKGDQPKPYKSKNNFSSSLVATSASNYEPPRDVSCAFCKQAHSIFQCADFLRLPIESRINEAKGKRLCINCLRRHHFGRFCKAAPCKVCSRRHNVLLHLNNSDVSPKGPPPAQDEEIQNISQPSTSTTISNHVLNKHDQILLPTATVRISDKAGKVHNCRALLDSASQSNFITDDLCALLGLKKHVIDMTVTGINQSITNISNKTNVTFQSKVNDYKSTISCITLPNITGNLPTASFRKSDLNIPPNIKLADESCNKPGKIDLLIGAPIFFDLLCIGQIKLLNGRLILQKTKLGWVFSGPLMSHLEINKSSCNTAIIDNNAKIDAILTKFWDLEDCSLVKSLSLEEKFCEKHFSETCTREPSGRFSVSIPLKDSIDKLGDSRKSAVKRFQSLERKLQTNVNFREKYVSFMREYEALGHMTKVSCDSGAITYYLPHHGVMREASTTTKLRVVFDGSAQSTSGISINNLQMVGPVIQDDLFSILVRFRKHRYVIAADVEKMYRQISINPAQRNLQRIVWRESPSLKLQDYVLNTVTYGLASSSFLAIRALQELGHISMSQYPKSSSIILHDFYVDDLLTGSNSIEEALQIKDEVSIILNKGCLKLRKWISNEPAIVHNSLSVDSDCLDLDPCKYTKTLGLIWRPIDDSISYVINLSDHSEPVTKRTILASTAKIFDPLGLLAPSIIIPKILMQQLWQYQLSWDEAIPNDLHTCWLRFKGEMMQLQQIKVPRLVIINNAIEIEVHGFSDASQKGYGSCIYVRSVDKIGNVCVRLHCAKSKVAPIKVTSIPRLELCGALLLARLAYRVVNSMKIEFKRVVCWSDSTVALAWIRAPSNTLKTFVGNRVAEIQDLTSNTEWRHVRPRENPADILSRGAMPTALINSEIWWQGPKWLSLQDSQWPCSPIIESSESAEFEREFRDQPTIIALITTQDNNNLFNRLSSLKKLQRCVAYCLRFKFNASVPIELRRHNPLMMEELSQSLNVLIKIAQRESFGLEVSSLSKGNKINSSSKLLPLNPFIHDGIIRVGGRLSNSDYDWHKKHPIVLPKSHKLTYLVVKQEHERAFHSGPQLLLASLREKYWPMSGRNVVRKIVRECLICRRAKPKVFNPLMGCLPRDRISQAPPFGITGVDYCGPISIKNKKGRGCATSKAYICIFICFTTKAMHIELVSDLTADAFIASLRRFVSRRGKPFKIWSDNAKNFVGASKDLKAFISKLSLQQENSTFHNYLIDECIDWKFIPPRSPHFGGLWEAGVKSVKFHLKRVMGNSMLTFEELCTLLTQIEAIVNSRPLSPLSSDPNDPTPLTPAHFLIGRSLIAVPEPNYTELKENRLSLYQRIQKTTQHFWSRWSKEYIGELQQRSKWRGNGNQEIKLGALVLLKEDNLPAAKWLLGRIMNAHPGADGVIRVVDVKVGSTIYKRAVTKVCPLPTDS